MRINLTSPEPCLSLFERDPVSTNDECASRQLYYQLLYNLRDFFLPHLDLVTLARVSRSSLAAYHSVLNYERIRHNFECDLARFFPLDDQYLLWNAMLESGCIISGSFPLQLLTNKTYPYSDLDMYCVLSTFWIIVDFLLGLNYTYFAEGDQPVDLDDLRTWIDEIADRRWDYPYGIIGVVNFMRDNGDASTSVIQLIVMHENPITCLLQFHSTCVMNFLGPGFLISLFPQTTLASSATVVNRVRAPTVLEPPLAKYRERGFATLSAPPVAQTCMTHSEFDPCRVIGDPGTLMIQLEGPRVQIFLDDNWDRCKRWLGKTHEYYVQVHRRSRTNAYTTLSPVDQFLLPVVRSALTVDPFTKDTADVREPPLPPDGAMAMAIFRRLRLLFYILRWKPRVYINYTLTKNFTNVVVKVYIPDMYPDFEDALLAFEPRHSLPADLKKYGIRFSIHLWQTPWRIDPKALHTLTVAPVDAIFSTLANSYPDAPGARRPRPLARTLLIDSLTKIFMTLDIEINFEFDIHGWEPLTGDLKLTVKVLLPERPQWPSQKECPLHFFAMHEVAEMMSDEHVDVELRKDGFVFT
ncbi:hypothetical protein V5O48_007248 [Marasmius crinis-equi]|uniref:Uncharacterized protein n=1 Tax=Marasmius crinis-equi TaxID=585013 RepID=A0ABR3FHA4_9AGAR